MPTADNTTQITPRILGTILGEHGLRRVVISPGSRNAPLIRAFAGFERYAILDERSAAFFALGLAQSCGEAVALLCTSGSACLNYAPAVAEAFYTQTPLFCITADRPPEWIDQMDGQTLHQHHIFAPHIRYSCSLPPNADSAEDFRYACRLVNEACHAALDQHASGPVQINIPLREPLYELSADPLPFPCRAIRQACLSRTLERSEALECADRIKCSSRTLVVLGALNPTPAHRQQLTEQLERCSRNGMVLLADHCCNLEHPDIIRGLDLLALAAQSAPNTYRPELLLYAGGAIVSKPLKRFLRNNPAAEHWRIHPDQNIVDLFGQISARFPLELLAFLQCITPILEQHGQDAAPKFADYVQNWAALAQAASSYSQDYTHSMPYSDLQFFSILHRCIPPGTPVQLANSSPVRYAQFFPKPAGARYSANRGLSGIDGCTSTALGSAWAEQKSLTLLISGDLAFQYDSNAFRHGYVSCNLRIIVINNGGGGIFRLLPETEGFPDCDTFIELENTSDLRAFAEQHTLQYATIRSQAELFAFDFEEFFAAATQPKLLEVFTPKERNAEVFRQYCKRFSP